MLGRGHRGRVVTLSPPTSEAGVLFPARPQVGKLIVACRWSAVYNTELWRTVCTGFLCPTNYPSSSSKTLFLVTLFSVIVASARRLDSNLLFGQIFFVMVETKGTTNISSDKAFRTSALFLLNVLCVPLQSLLNKASVIISDSVTCKTWTNTLQ